MSNDAHERRVLITVPRLDMPGGVANYYRTLRRHLPASCVYFEVGAKIGETGIRGKLARFLGDFREFGNLLKSEDFELVHLNPTLLPYSIVRDGVFLLMAKSHRLPVIVFFRGWDPAFARVVRRWFRWLFRRVYGRADAFVVLAKEFRDALADFGIKAPVFLETTVVADEVFDLPPPSRRESGKNDRRIVMLFMSRLTRGKGLEHLLQTTEMLRDRGLAVEVKIAGDGPERVAADEYVSTRGLSEVTFLGHVSGAGKRQAFVESDIFFYPTFYGEGMPNAVLEAMGYGLPVVTRSVGGIRDFFEQGRMGFITDSDACEVFADYIERLARDGDLRHEIGVHNRLYAEARFSAHRVADRLTQLHARV